jgi:hypothetical protein
VVLTQASTAVALALATFTASALAYAKTTAFYPTVNAILA